MKNQWTGGRYEEIINDEAQRNTGQNMEKLLRHMKNSNKEFQTTSKRIPKADNMRMEISSIKRENIWFSLRQDLRLDLEGRKILNKIICRYIRVKLQSNKDDEDILKDSRAKVYLQRPQILSW